MPILIRNGEILTDGSSVFTIAAAGLGLLEQRTVDPDPSLARTYTPSTGYDGFSQFTVNPIPSNYLIPTGTLNIVSNNTYDISTYSNVIVNVPTSSTIKNQNKTISLSTIPQSITFDVDSNNYTGLGTVTISAVPSNYIDTTVDPKDSSNLTVNGNIVTAAAGYYPSNASATVSTTTHPDPSISINTTNGLITATHQQTTGYVTGGTTTKTSQLNTINGTTITPTSLEQTLVAANYYTLGALKVAAVPIDTNFTAITSNGTYTAATGKYLTSVQVSVPTGSTVKNQNKTVTPQTTSFSVTFDVDSNNYTGLGTVTINAIPSNYIDTTNANAIAANILYNKTAYVDGNLITGSMPNNGALNNTISTQGGTYTIPAGYTSGGTITASLTTSTLTNSIINGSAFLEQTGNYGWRTTITIPAGYHNETTLTKDFSTILPAPTTEGTTNQVLAGYDLYNHEGELISGAMTNNGAWNGTLTDTTTSITIPAGYHNGSGIISHTTVAIPNPTITVSSSGLITANSNGTWTKGFTTNNNYSNTKQLTTKAATTYYPSTSDQTITSGQYLTGTQTIKAVTHTLTDASKIAYNETIVIGDSADADRITSLTGTFTRANTVSSGQTAAGAGQILSGYSAWVDSIEVKGNIATKTSSNLTASGATVTVPAGYYASQAQKSVQSGSATGPTSLSGSSATISTGTNTLTLTKTGITTTPTVSAGYVSSATASTATVSLTASVTTKAAATYYPSTSDQTISANQYLTGAQTIKAVVVSGLDASKILSGTTVNIGDSVDADRITSVSGNVSFVTYYTGSSAPSSSLGSNGDIYLQS